MSDHTTTTPTDHTTGLRASGPDDRLDLLASMIDRTVAVMANAAAGDTSRPTPCGEYDVAQLLEHLAVWAPVFEAAVGERPVPYDPATHRVDGNWDRVVADAGRAVVAGLRADGYERPMSMGNDPMPGAFVVNMLLMEYIGHGWDLCRAVGATPPYHDAEAEVALAAAQAIIAPQYRGSGMFDDIVEVADDAPPLDRLVGFLGRDPRWEPGA